MRLFEVLSLYEGRYSCVLCIAVLAVQAKTRVTGSNGQIPQLNLWTGKQLHTYSQGQNRGACIRSHIDIITSAASYLENKEFIIITGYLNKNQHLSNGKAVFSHFGSVLEVLSLVVDFQMEIDDTTSAALYENLLEMEKAVRKKLKDEDVEHAK